VSGADCAGAGAFAAAACPKAESASVTAQPIAQNHPSNLVFMVIPWLTSSEPSYPEKTLKTPFAGLFSLFSGFSVTLRVDADLGS
jgi:hypothetical protein